MASKAFKGHEFDNKGSCGVAAVPISSERLGTTRGRTYAHTRPLPSPPHLTTPNVRASEETAANKRARAWKNAARVLLVSPPKVCTGATINSAMGAGARGEEKGSVIAMNVWPGQLLHELICTMRRHKVHSDVSVRRSSASFHIEINSDGEFLEIQALDHLKARDTLSSKTHWAQRHRLGDRDLSSGREGRTRTLTNRTD